MLVDLFTRRLRTKVNEKIKKEFINVIQVTHLVTLHVSQLNILLCWYIFVLIFHYVDYISKYARIVFLNDYLFLVSLNIRMVYVQNHVMV